MKRVIIYPTSDDEYEVLVRVAYSKEFGLKQLTDVEILEIDECLNEEDVVQFIYDNPEVLHGI